MAPINEYIELFYQEALKEILDAPIDEAGIDYLSDKLKEVRQLVLDTIKAEK